ncbi:solute carrier family 15 member [Anaeramoeba flamelloides]|uniref:Solute carrier family 15 member n=1 Tax=Anaeramoeba flamelloides TaxID=1746091 RepID=A0AAV7YMB1_9EUKA|nr:solute carrier family 15 member [Anaeramoeba flamelloides]
MSDSESYHNFSLSWETIKRKEQIKQAETIKNKISKGVVSLGLSGSSTESTLSINSTSENSKHEQEEEELNELNNQRKMKTKINSRFLLILSSEFGERFCYFGNRSLIVLFFVFFGISEDRSTAYYHLFVFLCYFLPFFGAFIADSWLGKFGTILIFSWVYCLGCFLLSLSAYQKSITLTWVSLILMALGTGCIKPNVPGFLSDQFVPKVTPRLLTKLYSIFYFALNFGAFLATIFVPLLMSSVGFAFAFLLSAIVMSLSALIFTLGNSYFKKLKRPTQLVGRTFKTIYIAIKARHQAKKNKVYLPRDHWLDWAKGKPQTRIRTKHKSNRRSGKQLHIQSEPKLQSEGSHYPSLHTVEGEAFVNDLRSVFETCKLFLPLPIFWALFYQHASTWVLQTSEMDLSLPFVKSKAFQIQPSQVIALNPLLLMLLAPLMDQVIYPFLYKCKIQLTPIKRMSAGFIFLSISFIVAAILEIQIKSKSKKKEDKISWLWQIPQYILLTIADVLVSVTGLELTASESSVDTKSLLQRIWLLTTAIGNLLVVIAIEIHALNTKSEIELLFFVFSGLMIIFFLLFLKISKNFKYNVIPYEKRGDDTMIKEPYVTNLFKRFGKVDLSKEFNEQSLLLDAEHF